MLVVVIKKWNVLQELASPDWAGIQKTNVLPSMAPNVNITPHSVCIQVLSVQFEFSLGSNFECIGNE